MRKFFLIVVSFLAICTLGYSTEWRYLEFPVRISSNLAVCGNRVFVTAFDTTILGFWVERSGKKDTFEFRALTKSDFYRKLVNFDSTYDQRLRLFQGFLGGTLECTSNGDLWLVGLCAFKNYLGQDSFLYKLYVFSKDNFFGVTPILLTPNLDTISPLRSTRILGSGGTSLPWLFETKQEGERTMFLLAYGIETADGFAFVVKDTISFLSSLRVYFNGADVDGYGNLSFITNDLLKTISTKKTIRELRIDQMFPQSGLLCGLKIDKRSGNIYIFDRAFNLIKFDGTSWTFRKIPTVDTFSLDARKTALVAIDSLGNLWVTMNTGFKNIYKISKTGEVASIPLPKNLTGTLGSVFQIDKDGILYFVGNKLEVDSTIKAVLYYLDTKEFPNSVEKWDNLNGTPEIVFNLVSNILYIDFYSENPSSNSMVVDIYNLLGEKVGSSPINITLISNENNRFRYRTALDISNLFNGVYLVSIWDGSAYKIQKFIINK
ncbi:MAG: hypothetical protein N2560_06385 [Ignavibacteria bacterium]|nr:hypothetical protein [Ignavibacteria bacterium]